MAVEDTVDAAVMAVEDAIAMVAIEGMVAAATGVGAMEAEVAITFGAEVEDAVTTVAATATIATNMAT